MQGISLCFMLDDKAIQPTKAHEDDAGFDLYIPYDYTLYAGENAMVDTGVHVAIPVGYCGLICNKSGLSVRRNIESALGIIDSGYTGSIGVKLKNIGSEDHKFMKGDKISQLVLVEIPVIDNVTVVDKLEETDRGDGGFGSTGR